MIKIIITALDWSGTIFIIVGSLILSKKKMSNKTRLIVFISYLISNILWIPMSIIVGTYGLLLAQIILLIINVKGIYICLKNSDNIENT